MSSLSEFVTEGNDATVEPQNFELMMATQSHQPEELAHGMMANRDTKRVLKRSPFTRVQALTGCIQLPREDIHMEPLLASEFNDSGTDAASVESDTAEFFDFDEVLPPGMDYFGVPTPAPSQLDESPVTRDAASESIHNQCELAQSSTTGSLLEDGLTDFLLDQEELSSETKTSLEDIPYIFNKTKVASSSSKILRRNGRKLFEREDNLGKDAIKYWPSPSLPEAFHLSEAIIKFTRDVEAAINQEL